MILDRFLSTFSLVSRIPVKIHFTFDASRMDFYLPVIGVCPALLVFLVSQGLVLIMSEPLVISIIVLIVQYFCFNLFHLDGLMDSADAFLGTVDREKRLAILKDSRVGVYGFFAGFADLSLKAALLSALLPFFHQYAVLLLAYPISGRFGGALIPCLAKPANPGGLGALAKDAKAFRAILGFLSALIIWGLLAWGFFKLGTFVFGAEVLGGPAFPTWNFQEIIPIMPLLAISLCLSGPLAALFYARVYHRSLGGYTGDALGAAIETGELLHLSVAYIILSVAA
ncbi:cobalamin-5-phosphate synthase [Treponema primitia ZAS-2]|uniref:Adenosylcobinamide-GDP ribazoletransferase n=1 Tax=Treponema primitia (strain ATCC BAA-887 / DSM 12427 / ZAS-2) TaxID=545694 RepID=F5YL97_TREPZ|nr:adenosylcobinamide-GDP ribazoletransferase [Treponema primitia]AEF84449.1 cobalamin-5-phosphate synthase [Treponema primitia ZAS-2]